MRVWLIRHAPGMDGGALAGRRDIDADCSDSAALSRLAARLPNGAGALRSPARRCAQTAAALGLDATEDARLWEQSFGQWEGLPHGKLPDLGRLSPMALAGHRPEGGESFMDMAGRVIPVLRGLDRDTVIVAHAGTVRAALSLVVGPAALAFSVAPLSLTVMQPAGRDWAVEGVNLTC